jgi:hypothetical protein
MIDSLLTLRISRALPTHTVEVVRLLDTLQVTARQSWRDHRDTQVDSIWAVGKIVDFHAPDMKRRIRVIPSMLARVCLVVWSAMRGWS